MSSATGSRVLLSFSVFLALVATNALAFGRAAAARAPETAAEWKAWTTDRLVETATPDLFQMPVDAHTFHYSPARADNYLNPMANWTPSVNGSTRNAFHVANPPWEVKEFSDWYGFGFYVALDPVSSRNYGSPNAIDNPTPDYTHPWILYRVTLARGTKILNIVKRTPLPADVIQQLRTRFNCTAQTVEQMFLMSREDLRGCRQFLDQMLTRLQATALLYGWQTRDERYPVYCRYPTAVGFLLTGNLPNGSVRVFSRAMPPSGSDAAQSDRVTIQDLFITRRGQGGLLWPALEGNRPSTTEAQSYVRDHIFGCGATP